MFNCAKNLESKDLSADVIVNPENNDTRSINYNIESPYCDVKRAVKELRIGDKGFSLLHCNARSLSKNLSYLNDILFMCKEMPSFIAISETKLNDRSTINISLEGYVLETKHSPTSAGGEGIYVKENIEFTRRRDLGFDFQGTETCFLEIPKSKGKRIIVACVYWHPSSNIETFHQLLCKTLENINRPGYEAYRVTGDINVNLHAYSLHKATSDYLDMQFSLGYLPLITKATRKTDHSKTLIDHI